MADRPIDWEPIGNLLLDPENPRLPEVLQGKSQKDILRYIARNEAVEDLMSAIGRNGFFAGEPLVVYRNTSDPKGKLRVIEGNRRLASVLLLRDPALYAERRSLKEIADESPKANKPDELPTIRVDERNDALPYLGSRHIVGVKSWEPLQKARYMYQLFSATKSNSAPSERYRDVASRIGSGNRRDYIKKNLDALAVFDEMKRSDFYGDEETDESNFSFGVLYTALAAKPIAGYVGVIKYDPKHDTVKQEADPIVNRGALKKDRIKDFYRWCFQRDEEGRTVLGESRNIPRLAAVLKSEKAVAILRSTLNLDLAYEKSGGVADELEGALARALKELRYSNSIVANSDYRATVDELAGQVRQQATQVVQAIKAKKEPSED